MRLELAVALISGLIALTGVVVSAWATLRAKANEERIKALEAEQLRQRSAGRYTEPLARATNDLQSRIYNILNRGFLEAYLDHGESRSSRYALENTVFLFAQYFAWTELARRELQFVDLGENAITKRFLYTQDTLQSVWQTDRFPPLLRVFAGEQRAIGELLLRRGTTGLECISYGTFLDDFPPGKAPLIDALREDVTALKAELKLAKARLVALQHGLIDMLDILDPKAIRVPKDRRTRIA
ncbi:MAG: hypothetical protein ACOYOH_20030 [Paracraurococcus sp.]